MSAQRIRVAKLLQTSYLQFAEQSKKVPKSPQLIADEFIKTISSAGAFSIDLLFYKYIQFILYAEHNSIDKESLIRVQKSLGNCTVSKFAADCEVSLIDFTTAESALSHLLQIRLSSIPDSECELSTVLPVETELMLREKASHGIMANEIFFKNIPDSTFKLSSVIGQIMMVLQEGYYDYDIKEIWDFVALRICEAPCDATTAMFRCLAGIITHDCTANRAVMGLLMYTSYQQALYMHEEETQEHTDVESDIEINDTEAEAEPVPDPPTGDSEHIGKSVTEMLDEIILEDPVVVSQTDVVEPSASLLNEPVVKVIKVPPSVPPCLPTSVSPTAIAADQSPSASPSVPPTAPATVPPVITSRSEQTMASLEKFVSVNKHKFPNGLPKLLTQF